MNGWSVPTVMHQRIGFDVLLDLLRSFGKVDLPPLLRHFKIAIHVRVVWQLGVGYKVSLKGKIKGLHLGQVCEHVK